MKELNAMIDDSLTEKANTQGCCETGESLFTLRYFLAVVALFLVTGGNWILLSPLTLYVETQLGSEVIAGFVLTGYSVGALLTRIFVSPFISAHNYGWLVAFGATAFGIASLITLSTGLNVAVLLAARFAQGLGQGVSSVAIQTGVAYMVPVSRLGEGISVAGTATIFALAVFPPAAMAVTSYVNGTDDGYSFLLTVSIAFMVIVALCGLYIQRGILKKGLSTAGEMTGSGKRENIGEKKRFKGFELSALPPSVANAAVGYCQGFIMAFVAVFCAEKGFDGSSSFFSAFAVSVLAVRLGAFRIVSRCPPRILMIVAFLMGMLGMVALPFVPVGAIWVSALLFGVCAGLVNPYMQVLAVSSCSRAGAGAATGMFLACIDVSMMVSATFGGLLIEKCGYDVAFLFCAALLTLGLLVYLLSARSNRKTVSSV